MDPSSEVNHRLILLQLTPHAGRFKNRGDTCFTSNLPIIAGHYSTAAKRGSYFEITIRHMSGNGTIALGMQCLPYPPNRLPGWHRKSAALHFDDRRLFYEDSEGGQDYMQEIYDPKSGKTFRRHNVPQIKANDILGCGYEFKLNGGVGHLFYTYNGELLPIAFPGIFEPMPLGQEVDVFAAVGVTDGPCQFDVNFGLEKFKWSGPSHSHQGAWNRDKWTVDGLFKHFGDGPPQYGD
ncbi:hypothetical protein B0H19DRAFT_924897 [Mycena capillaripes]|nr:hypothetical protein B0H19DRAFT_924897 [Mycena capillaripes]